MLFCCPFLTSWYGLQVSGQDREAPDGCCVSRAVLLGVTLKSRSLQMWSPKRVREQDKVLSSVTCSSQ